SAGRQLSPPGGLGSEYPTLDLINKAPVTRGITLGLKDILNAREVLLLVTGEGKQDATERFLTAKVSTAIPASFLWLHSNFICLINT
ncbi:6-phosphogluconolactonase, partial [Escherichia coli]